LKKKIHKKFDKFDTLKIAFPAYGSQFETSLEKYMAVSIESFNEIYKVPVLWVEQVGESYANIEGTSHVQINNMGEMSCGILPPICEFSRFATLFKKIFAKNSKTQLVLIFSYFFENTSQFAIYFLGNNFFSVLTFFDNFTLFQLGFISG